MLIKWLIGPVQRNEELKQKHRSRKVDGILGNYRNFMDFQKMLGYEAGNLIENLEGHRSSPKKSASVV